MVFSPVCYVGVVVICSFLCNFKIGVLVFECRVSLFCFHINFDFFVCFNVIVYILMYVKYQYKNEKEIFVLIYISKKRIFTKINTGIFYYDFSDFNLNTQILPTKTFHCNPSHIDWNVAGRHIFIIDFAVNIFTLHFKFKLLITTYYIFCASVSRKNSDGVYWRTCHKSRVNRFCFPPLIVRALAYRMKLSSWITIATTPTN